MTPIEWVRVRVHFVRANGYRVLLRREAETSYWRSKLLRTRCGNIVAAGLSRVALSPAFPEVIKDAAVTIVVFITRHL